MPHLQLWIITIRKNKIVLGTRNQRHQLLSNLVVLRPAGGCRVCTAPGLGMAFILKIYSIYWVMRHWNVIPNCIQVLSSSQPGLDKEMVRKRVPEWTQPVAVLSLGCTTLLCALTENKQTPSSCFLGGFLWGFLGFFFLGFSGVFRIFFFSGYIRKWSSKC